MAFQFDQNHDQGAAIKVIGIGGGGCNAVNTMVAAQIDRVNFLVANTDLQALEKNRSPVKIQLGKNITKGLGAGADPDVGKNAARENMQELKDQLASTDMLFIAAGMGGGTGTGAAPVIAEAAKSLGILSVGVVTTPFNFEGKSRNRIAELGVIELEKHVDSLIVIPNEKLFNISERKMSLLDGFKMADEVLLHAIKSISELINIPGLINLDFADVKTIMSDMGKAFMGIGTHSGENRGAVAAKKALSNPLLSDISIRGARGILINITGDSSLTLHDLEEATQLVQQYAHEDANIIFGAVIDESLEDTFQITVIATGFSGVSQTQQQPQQPPRQDNVVKVGTIISEFTEEGDYDIPTFVRKRQSM